MKAMLRLEEPAKMKATITATMTMKEWQALQKKLIEGPYDHIVSKFAELIGKAIDDASATFTSTLMVSTDVNSPADVDTMGKITRAMGDDR